MELTRLAGWVLPVAITSVLVCCSKSSGGPVAARAAFARVGPADDVADADADVLTIGDVDAIVAGAAAAVDSPNMAICVLDRLGHILRVWNRRPDAQGPNAFDFVVATDPDPAVAQVARLNRGAVGIARAATFLSHSEAPLTSRTGQFISTFHFPAVFDTRRFDRTLPDGSVPVRPTIGVKNTPQGPLWQIDASNRGAVVESVHGGLRPPTVFNAGMDYPPALLPNGEPSVEGLTALPGGFPLYKQVGFRSPANPADPILHAPDFSQDPLAPIKISRRAVGGIGVYIEDDNGDPLPEVAEFAAINGILAARAFPVPLPDEFVTGDASKDARRTTLFNSFAPLPFRGFQIPPSEGAVFLVGILLPAFEQDTRPPGTSPGVYDEALTVAPRTGVFDADDGPVDNSKANTVRNFGAPDPSGFILGPVDSPSGVPFTAAEVRTILLACVGASTKTHAAIRSPDYPGDGAQKPVTPCQMFISICDVDGVVLGVYREPDATSFSLEIAYTKARNAVYYSHADSIDFGGPRAGRHPLAGIVPPGTAVTARSLGFLSQPFFPPNIDSSPLTGPLFQLAVENRNPVRFNQMGWAPASPAQDPGVIPGTQSGIIFFPGSAPLYRNGVLIGGIGVSGDGVEQDDLVTIRGIRNAQRQLGFQIEPPLNIRCDQFGFEGVGIPYAKFPQHPNG